MLHLRNVRDECTHQATTQASKARAAAPMAACLCKPPGSVISQFWKHFLHIWPWTGTHHPFSRKTCNRVSVRSFCRIRESECHQRRSFDQGFRDTGATPKPKKNVRDGSQGLNTFSQRARAHTARSQRSTNQMHYHCDIIQHTLLLVYRSGGRRKDYSYERNCSCRLHATCFSSFSPQWRTTSSRQIANGGGTGCRLPHPAWKIGQWPTVHLASTPGAKASLN